jgi:hypothetical protein
MSTYKVDNIDATLNLQDGSDPTKKLKLDLSNLTTSTTRTWTVPDTNSIFVGLTNNQILTNKTIDINNNTISNITNTNIKTSAAIDATKIADGSVNNTKFQYLNNLSSSTAGISDTQTLTNKTFTDASTYFQDNLDNTKKLQFQLSGITTSTTRILTIPDLNTTVVGTTANQTLTNKSFDADQNTISNIDNVDIKASASIDATKIADGTVTNTEFQYLNSITSAIVGVSDTQTLTNKTINTASNTITIAAADVTSGTFADARITASNITQHEGSITIGNLTGAPTDTVVGTTDTQTFTNKTITATTNDVTAKSLHSASTSIDVATATSPTSGQVLTATSSTVATWQTPSSSSITSSTISATAITNTTSGTYAVINGMTTTPASGTYVVLFSTSLAHSSGSSDATYAVHKAGTIITNSKRHQGLSGGQHSGGFVCSANTQAVITVNGSEAIDVRWNNGGSGTFTCYDRSIILLKIS